MTLYLIAHKVRGQATFDVAEKLQIGQEEGWIIPTSGHRAYPFVTIELSSLVSAAYPHPDMSYESICRDIPADLPDHYSANDTKPKPQSDLSLEDLGL